MALPRRYQTAGFVLWVRNILTLSFSTKLDGEAQ